MTSSLGPGARSSICSVLCSSCTSILRISAASSAVGEASGNSSAATLPLRGWRNCFSFSAKREMTDGPTYSVSAQLVHAPSRFDSPKVKECLFRLVCFSFISSRFSHWSLENNDEDMTYYSTHETQNSKHVDVGQSIYLNETRLLPNRSIMISRKKCCSLSE